MSTFETTSSGEPLYLGKAYVRVFSGYHLAKPLQRATLKYIRGFSYNARTRRFVDMAHEPEAYAVAVRGHGCRFLHRPTTFDWFLWLAQHLDVAMTDSFYIGYWYDLKSGLHYIDISEVVFAKEQALMLASARGEKCVYHFATDGDVYVDELEECGYSNRQAR